MGPAERITTLIYLHHAIGDHGTVHGSQLGHDLEPSLGGLGPRVTWSADEGYRRGTVISQYRRSRDENCRTQLIAVCNAARDCRQKYSALLQAGSETETTIGERDWEKRTRLGEFEQGGPAAQVREGVDGVLELEGG